MRSVLRFLLLAPFWLLATAWASAALWIDGPVLRPVAAALAIAFAVGSLVLVFGIRPRWRNLGLGVWVAGVAAVVVWELAIPPSNARDWLPDVRNAPRASIQGDQIRIQNLRNFEYRSETDYTERWEERTYDLSKLQGVDLFLSYWGSPWIAHTIASWDFGSDGQLAISIETRKEQGEEYSTVRGFFRQYELYYVVADERDVIRLRTNFRGEDVYVYRMNMPVARARALLVSYLDEIDQLAEQPQWYNAITDNCTTSIRHRVADAGPTDPFNWRMLLNGRLDELIYARGRIDTRLPFDETRRRSYVTARARVAGEGTDFSSLIRTPDADPGIQPPLTPAVGSAAPQP